MKTKKRLVESSFLKAFQNWSKENPNGIYEDYTEEEKKQREKDKAEVLSDFDRALLSLRETRNFLLLKTDWIVRTSPERLQAMSEKYYPQLRLSPSKGENIEFINREIEKN